MKHYGNFLQLFVQKLTIFLDKQLPKMTRVEGLNLVNFNTPAFYMRGYGNYVYDRNLSIEILYVISNFDFATFINFSTNKVHRRPKHIFSKKKKIDFVNI